MRAIAYYLLTHHQPFVDLVPSARVFEQSSIGKDPSQIGISGVDGPFAIISMFGPNPAIRKNRSLQTAEVRVTVHTVPGTYKIHDLALKEATAAFETAAGTWVAGYWLQDAYWTDTGDDFLDDGFGTTIKTASHHFVASTEKLR